MYCSNCGTQQEDNVQFCQKCGQLMPMGTQSQPLNQPQPQQQPIKFYQKTWFVWVMLIFFAPVGIFLIWRQNRFNKVVRIILSVFFGLFFLAAMVSNAGNETNSPTKNPTVEVSASESEKSSKSASTSTPESSAASVSVSESSTASVSTPEIAPEIYDLKFEPEITYTISGNEINVIGDFNMPDNTIIQATLISGDLNVMLSETAEVKDKKCSIVFELPDIEPMKLGLNVLLQFNAESIVQPDATKKTFGDKGEKLEGKNASESSFKDGTKGKNGNVMLIIDYPNTEAVQDRMMKLYSETIDEIISTSNGVIVSIQPARKDDYSMIYVTVSDAWYNSQEYEKERFAETVGGVIENAVKNAELSDHTSVFFYDIYSKKLADPKMFGGYKILR